MSKSRGNVINPDDVIEKFGADTLRVYELFIGPFDQVVSWSENGLEGCYRFLTKAWRLQDKERLEESNPETEKTIHKTIKKITEDIESRSFNTAISSLMILVNELQKEDKISSQNLRTLATLLTPFAPHMAEEMFANNQGEGSVHLQAWPKYDEEKIQDSTATIAIAINGKTRETIEVSKDIGKEDAIAEAKQSAKVQKHLEDKQIIKEIYVPGKMINFVAK